MRKTKLLIVIYHPFDLWRAPESFAERIHRAFPNVQVVRRDDYKDLDRELPDTDILMSWSITAEQIRIARKLRWIHSPAAAVHRLMIPELQSADIVVTSARQVHGPVVAEHVIALVFALSKRLPSAFRYQQQHKWAQELMWRESTPPREIAGSTLGLVGVGSIGGEVARRASALGMRVVAVRGSVHASRTVNNPEGVSETYPIAELEKLLSQSDYVVLAAPVTPQTRGMINGRTLAVMKRDAYLVNVSRGALIDEPALIDALNHRQIAGAALDVFEQEPLPPESPFWTMDNVLITPHSAALTDKLWDRHFELLSQNLRRFMAGEPLLGQVDKSRGY